ncbi:hypothetical protein O181_063327 [Austropuccinia psidii MF-1]|uniref:Uncharacterized protein n=1 Tax=Austropuccinia psidii MF-1 TaxID=1389203 RepID=A0A9Q3EPF2_9BASI|nr:hypothetical protein [Austropuccinia psidii MF-1]
MLSEGRHFCNCTIVNNNGAAFTSAGVKVNLSSQRQGIYCYCACGELQHIIGSIFPHNAAIPIYWQVFILRKNDNELVWKQKKSMNSNACADIIFTWKNFLTNNNHYAQAYRMAHNVLNQQQFATLTLTTLKGIGYNTNTYNCPKSQEVAAIVQGKLQNWNPHDILLQWVGGGYLQIKDTHSGELPL